MKQLKVALPDPLRHQLEEAAEASGRSLADEIRTRVESTFPDVDLATRSVQEAIGDIARRLEEDFGASWYLSSETRQAFASALSTVAAQIAGKRRPWMGTEWNDRAPGRVSGAGAVSDAETIGRMRAPYRASLARAVGDPETVGRMRARDWFLNTVERLEDERDHEQKARPRRRRD